MLRKLLLIISLLVCFPLFASAALNNPLLPFQGGTGSTTLSGILVGNGASPLNTLTIGSNLTLTGTTLSVSGISSASSTLLTDANTFSGVNLFTNSSSNFSGTWQTFSPSHFQTALGFTAVPNTRLLNTTYPVTGGGDLSADRTIALAFGTTTSNTWAGTQTFTNLITGSISGNAGTATALASNPTNCAAGNYPLGIDASGNVESCTAANTGTLTAVTGTWPIISSGGNTPNITFGGLSTSTAAVVGNLPYFSGVNTFANVATGTVSAGSSAITVTAGRSAIGGALAIDCATSASGQNGCLSSTDWSTFNSKLSSYDAFTHAVAGTSATTTPLMVIASTTIGAGGVTTGLTVSGTATTTNLIDTSITSALGLFDAQHKLVAYGGASACSNQFVTALSAVGASTCASVTDATLSGQVAVAHGGTGVSALPSFSVNKNSVTQSIINASFIELTFGTEVFDTNNNFASSTFTPTVAGKYLISLQATLLSMPAGETMIAAIYKNGAAIAWGRSNLGSLTNTGAASATQIVSMNGSTDNITFYIYHEAGSTINASGAAVETYASGAWIAP